MPDQEEIKNMNFGVNVLPKEDEKYHLGDEDLKWETIHGKTIYGDTIIGMQKLKIGGQEYDGTTEITIPIYDGSYT